jgi:hypothetical protein
MNDVKVQQSKSVKIYKAPRLSVFGGMSQLTAAGSLGAAEGNGVNRDDPDRRK